MLRKNAIIKVAHLKAISGHDDTNSGIPTSATPIGKKKVIPNSRRDNGKDKGGQPGHEKHKIQTFGEAEITETIPHELGKDDQLCGKCGGKLVDTGGGDQQG